MGLGAVPTCSQQQLSNGRPPSFFPLPRLTDHHHLPPLLSQAMTLWSR